MVAASVEVVRMSSGMMTVLGIVAAALSSVVGAAAAGEILLDPSVVKILATLNALLGVFIGKTHRGTAPTA